jgi:hypothetical protein
MAPKLPPPANTKAVFAGTAWFDTDKVLFAPGIVALANRHATFGCGYSSGRADRIINIGCDATPSFRDGPKDQTSDAQLRIGESGNYDVEIRVRAHARPGMTAWKRKDSAFDERLLDHEMTGLAVIAFGKTARFEHLAQLFQHGRAAAHHDPVGLDIERRLADIVKQLL